MRTRYNSFMNFLSYHLKIFDAVIIFYCIKVSYLLPCRLQTGGLNIPRHSLQFIQCVKPPSASLSKGIPQVVHLPSNLAFLLLSAEKSLFASKQLPQSAAPTRLLLHSVHCPFLYLLSRCALCFSAVSLGKGFLLFFPPEISKVD